MRDLLSQQGAALLCPQKCGEIAHRVEQPLHHLCSGSSFVQGLHAIKHKVSLFGHCPIQVSEKCPLLMGERLSSDLWSGIS